MLHKGVDVTVQSDCRVLVTEDLGKCFYIHAAFEGAGGKRMSQGMESFVRDIKFFQEQLKTSQVRAYGNGISVT